MHLLVRQPQGEESNHPFTSLEEAFNQLNYPAKWAGHEARTLTTASPLSLPEGIWCYSA